MYVLQEKLAGGDTHLVRLVLNSRHTGGDVGGMYVVGEADKRDIIGYAKSLVLNGCESCKGDDIVKGKNGIRRIGLAKQLFDGPKGYVIVYLITDNKAAVYLHVIISKGFQIAMFAASNHINVVGSADESDALASRVYKVLCSHLCSLVAICRDR